MAQAMIEAGDPGFDKQALDALNDDARKDQDDPMTWHLLATIYGREGKENWALLDTAEEAYAEGRYKDAKGQAQYALKQFPFGSVGAIRAQDIVQTADDALKNSR